jgi:hypothetical protein
LGGAFCATRAVWQCLLIAKSLMGAKTHPPNPSSTPCTPAAGRGVANERPEIPQEPHLSGRPDVSLRCVGWGARLRKRTPLELWVAEGLWGKLAIAQIRHARMASETISTLIGSCDSVVLWAPDHATDRAIVAEVEGVAIGRLH